MERFHVRNLSLGIGNIHLHFVITSDVKKNGKKNMKEGRIPTPSKLAQLVQEIEYAYYDNSVAYEKAIYDYKDYIDNLYQLLSNVMDTYDSTEARKAIDALIEVSIK